MRRYIQEQAISDFQKKMLFIAGPRQCGKTTLVNNILSKQNENDILTQYLNWDVELERARILSREFLSKLEILAFDEIHKYARWRNLLKDLYDSKSEELKIIVTGSARLDYYRRGGDSLQGRYNLLRMHPLSLTEVYKERPNETSNNILLELFKLGNFPEPFLSGDKDEARRWSNQYRIRLIREELADLEKISEISLLEELIFRLPECVGSPLSINSLREDLQLSHQTVSRWLKLLERIYSIYRLLPFGSPRIKAVKKETKHYHWDWSIVENEGARFENLTASHLLKWCNWMEDTKGYFMELRFFRDREQREVDFVILQDKKPIEFIECKLSKEKVSNSLKYLKNKYPETSAIQISLEECEDLTTKEGIRICDASTYLIEKI